MAPSKQTNLRVGLIYKSEGENNKISNMKNSTSAHPSKFTVGNPGRPPQAPCHRYDDGDDDAEMITIITTPHLTQLIAVSYH